MNKLGVLIGNYHTFRDWGLGWTDATITMPEPQTHTIEVPGRDGYLDFTESVNGYVRYGSRDVKLEFDVQTKGWEAWNALVSDIASKIHGRYLKVILDTDNIYYYEGRVKFTPTKENYLMGNILIEITAQPYKVEVRGSMDPWLWDELDFVNGVIRTAEPAEFHGELVLEFPPTKMPTSPKFIFEGTGSATILHEEKSYTINDGESKSYPELMFTDKLNVITLQGDGVMAIDYRGGVL